MSDLMKGFLGGLVFIYIIPVILSWVLSRVYKKDEIDYVSIFIPLENIKLSIILLFTVIVYQIHRFEIYLKNKICFHDWEDYEMTSLEAKVYVGDENIKVKGKRCKKCGKLIITKTK